MEVFDPVLFQQLRGLQRLTDARAEPGFDGLPGQAAQPVQGFDDIGFLIFGLLQGLLEPAMADKFPLRLQHRIRDRRVDVGDLCVHQGGHRQIVGADGLDETG